MMRSKSEGGGMFNITRHGALLLLVAVLGVPGAQGADRPPLVLEATIPLENTGGRIDHMAVDLPRQRLLVAELGNGTIDVIDLAARKVVGRISGLREPQGVGYAEKTDRIAVASAGDGTLRFYGGADLAPVGMLALGDDADNVRIDPRNGHVVVGYGDGGLAVIDPQTHDRLADIRLPGHPEGFQIDPIGGRALVNVPGARQIAIIDLATGRAVGNWRLPGVRGNFPMALNQTDHVLAAVFRDPPTLILVDPANGGLLASLSACADADDVFFDDRRKRIYVSCGDGEVAAWHRDAAGYHRLPSTKTQSGARTSLFVPELDRLFVAQRAGMLGTRGALLVYRPED
jgi:hypothetical protein